MYFRSLPDGYRVHIHAQKSISGRRCKNMVRRHTCVGQEACHGSSCEAAVHREVQQYEDSGIASWRQRSSTCSNVSPKCQLTTWLLLVVCCCLSRETAAASRKNMRNSRATIVESIFFSGKGTDGWMVQGARWEQMVHVGGPSAREDEMAIEVKDHGAEIWYFTSGPHFAGDKTAAYNGELSFKLYHKRLPPASRSQPLKLDRVGVDSADVILEAQCGHALYMAGVLDRARGVPTAYSFSLAEDAGWIDSRTGNPPQLIDMLGLLANLKAIKIRGSFYRDPEIVRLQDVRLATAVKGAVSGRDLFPCCSRKHPGEMDVCTVGAQDTVLTPQGISFDCKGSFKEIVRVKTIYPRFARRSGGTVITVTGENFGLSGSRTILRVNGRPARGCQYPITEFIVGNAPVANSSLAKHCINGKWDLGEDGVDCGGDDCPICYAPVLPSHCLNSVLDSALGETKLGLTKDNMGNTRDCGGPCQQPDHCCDDTWQEYEAKQNCGGTSCLPCNMPTLPTGTSVERNVLAHGQMSRRGCFCNVFISNLSISCPAENSTAWQATAPAIVPTARENHLYWDEENLQPTGTHRYANNVGMSVNVSDCENVVFLDLLDTVVDGNDYLGKYIQISGGPGAGQVAKIKKYDPRSKMANVGPWNRNGEQRNVEINTQKSVLYVIGYAEVKKGGSGYSDGVWSIPSSRIDAANATFKYEGAWGYFKTDKATGSIISVQVVNNGRFDTEFSDGRFGIKKLEYVLDVDIKCTRQCDGQGAQIFVAFRSNEIIPPNNQSTYMIVDQQHLQSQSGRKAGHITSKPKIDQHRTLICELEAGEGKDQQIDIQSFDQGNTPVSSCYNDLSRGFEFGAHDHVWSLQVGIRQPDGVREISVAAIDIDKRNGDIYLAGKIMGLCDEGYSGCLGVLGSHLPDRGRTESGPFKPLFLDPNGGMSTFVMKLDKFAKPLWATMIDCQNQFGRIVPWSLVVDSTQPISNIYVAGTYLTTQKTPVRFWHVNEVTKRPTRISREEVDLGGGSCNQVSCTGDLCTSSLPAGDDFKCADGASSQTCRLSRCAYIQGFESRDETQDDVWLAEISTNGRWIWTKMRIGFSRRGFTLMNSNGLLKLATTPSGYDAPLAEAGSAVYMSFTVDLIKHDLPDLVFSLGHVAHEFWGLDVDEEDLENIAISFPITNSTRYGLLAKFSQGGVLWARRIGPLGESGNLMSLKTDGTHIYVAGSYQNTSFYHSEFAYDTCQFGHSVHGFASTFRSPFMERSTSSAVLPVFTNPMCFPFGKIYAHYTMDSWERSGPQQWDDISGNGLHAVTSKGAVRVGVRNPSHGAQSFQNFLYGGKTDGMKFPANSIPTYFTICSVSRMSVMSEGSILDSADIANWAHGHYGGHPAQAWYGTVQFQTDAGVDKDGGHTWDGLRIEEDDWIIMCGQNKEENSVFLANGVNTGKTSGGYGGGQLTINHGKVGLMRGYSQWEILEVAIWDFFLSPFEIKSVMMYYQHILRDGSSAAVRAQKALFSAGVKNLFLASYTHDGQLRWHREAVSGNLTTTALTVSRRDVALGGVDNTRIKGPINKEFDTNWVYVAGIIHGETVPADFGISEFPQDCSAGKTLGEHLTQNFVPKCNDIPGWKSRTDATCSDYEGNQWCADKGVGPGWPIWSGHFSLYGNNDGVHAGMACCECGGGQIENVWIDRSPCSGQIVARGMHTDIFLAKYSADTGQLAWLKRLGQRDTVESPVDIITDDHNHEVLMVGDFYNEFSNQYYRDIFDLVAAGRPAAVGCQVDRIDDQVKIRLGKTLTDDQVGYPNCSIVGSSISPRQISAFILSVDALNSAHGSSAIPSRPGSQCNTTEELGCNADGLLWARALGSGIREASTRVSTRALGLAKSSFRNQILAWGMFSGFITATGTRGVRTQGVDDEGFFNCCLKLNIPLVLDELQDVWETYIVALES